MYAARHTQLSGSRREIQLEQELTQVRSMLQAERERSFVASDPREGVWRDKYLEAQREVDRLKETLPKNALPFDDGQEVSRLRDMLADRDKEIRSLEAQVRSEPAGGSE